MDDEKDWEVVSGSDNATAVAATTITAPQANEPPPAKPALLFSPQAVPEQDRISIEANASPATANTSRVGSLFTSCAMRYCAIM